MKRDIKYIIKRIIIGTGIALCLFYINSCKAHALTTIDNVSADVYFKSQYCTESESISTNNISGSRFTCETGPSYKFAQLLNNSSNVDVPFLITENQLINNMTFKINFEDPVEITSTNRYIVLNAPWTSFDYDHKAIGISNSYFTLNGVRPNGNTTDLSPSISTYFNQVEYCNYSDGSNTYKCNSVTISRNSSYDKFVFYIDVPEGTNVHNITLFFGNNNILSSYDIYSSEVNGWFRAITTTQNAYQVNITSSYNSFNNYKQLLVNFKDNLGNHYNIYGSNFYSGAGLVYYKYAPTSPTFSPSNITDNLYFETTVPTTSYSPVYSFANISTSDTDYYNGLVNSIEQELNPVSNNDAWFEDSLDGFISGSQANSLIGLFNSLLVYPFQKLNEQKQVDLVRQNINGNYILNSNICMKNMGQDTILNEYVPYQIQFYRDYKFNLPCPHTEIYTNLKYGDYAFYSTTFLGANMGNSGASNSFSSLWLTIQHGFLVYILFVTCLNVYKYLLDSNKTEIEVLEL